MHQLFILFTISLSAIYFQSAAQQRVPEPTAEEKERLAFENTLDSLFLRHDYKQILDLCGQPQPGHLQSACIYNLIGAYYFSGDSTASWELLNKEIAGIRSFADADAYSMNSLLSKNYTSYRKFLVNSTAKIYILGVADSLYLAGPASDKENGLELLHLLIEDQWIRNTSSLYDHLRPARRHPLPSHMDSVQAMQAQHDHCSRVFDFYKTRNKVFSKAEVARIYYWQLMLFFHEWDMTRRSIYHELVKRGVKEGALSIEDQMNFEVGTEYIKMGTDAFFSNREAIQERYRKQYGIPGFRIRLM